MWTRKNRTKSKSPDLTLNNVRDFKNDSEYNEYDAMNEINFEGGGNRLSYMLDDDMDYDD